MCVPAEALEATHPDAAVEAPLVTHRRFSWTQCSSSPHRLPTPSPHRRRGRSLDRSPTPLPLTRENLRQLERRKPQSTMRAPRNPSPTRKDTAVADVKQLARYNITIDSGIAPPKVLAEFIITLRQNRFQSSSPHAQAIVDTRRVASMTNEITARAMMEKHILFRGEGYPDGIAGLSLKNQVNLAEEYLPDPPRATVQEVWGSLPRPQPDSCIGYVTAADAKKHTPTIVIPFTDEEDDMADWYSVVHNAETHFPFLTAQWKSANSGMGHFHASIQAARDGALIVNYMHRFYSLAYPNRPPTPLETAHFSVTTEGYTIIIWMHWREVHPQNGEVYFRMEPVENVFMSAAADLCKMRQFLHNYIDYAMGERLNSIKKALPAFWPNRLQRKAAASKSQSSLMTTSVSEMSSRLWLDIPRHPPSSVGASDSVPPKKMKRRRMS